MQSRYESLQVARVSDWWTGRFFCQPSAPYVITLRVTLSAPSKLLPVITLLHQIISVSLIGLRRELIGFRHSHMVQGTLTSDDQRPLIALLLVFTLSPSSERLREIMGLKLPAELFGSVRRGLGIPGLWLSETEKTSPYSVMIATSSFSKLPGHLQVAGIKPEGIHDLE